VIIQYENLTIVFTKVTSISIHHLSPYRFYKRCPRTFVQVVEDNPPIKNKRGTRTLYSCHGLHSRLQAIKLLANLTHLLKTTKGQTIDIQTPPTTYISSMSDTASGSTAGAASAGGTRSCNIRTYCSRVAITAALSTSSKSCFSLACSRCMIVWVRSSTIS
jgi:hypothetical protein